MPTDVVNQFNPLACRANFTYSTHLFLN